MIDTVSGYFEPQTYQVSKRGLKNFTFKEVSIPNKIPLVSCYLNDKKHDIRVDLKPDKRLFVTFEAPKIIAGHSLYEIKENDRDEVKSRLRSTLTENGIEVDFSQVNLSRLDISKNIEIDGNLKDYLTAHRSCTIPRMKLDQRTFNFNTLKWLNGKAHLTMYNKVGQLIDRELSKPKNLRDLEFTYTLKKKEQNILRIEYRTLSKQKTFDTYGKLSFDDLFNKDKVYILPSIYDKLSTNKDTELLTFESLEQTYRIIKNSFPSGTFPMFALIILEQVSGKKLVDIFGDQYRLDEFLRTVESKTNAWRLSKKMRQHSRINMNELRGLTFKTIKNEITNKLKVG